MTLYRDPLATARSQILAKRVVLEERERELPPLLRAMAPAALRLELAELRSRVLAAPDDASVEGALSSSMEALTAEENALDAVLGAYDELAAMAGRLREASDEVPDPAPPRVGPPFTIEEPSQRRFRAALEKRVCEVFGTDESRVERWGDHGFLARHRVGPRRVPVNLHAVFEASRDFESGFGIALYTSVPIATPSLKIRPRGMHHALGAFIGVTRDRSLGRDLGVADFDRAFVVTVEEDATALVSGAVARALLALAALAPQSTTLAVRQGMVELTWRGPAEDEMDPSGLLSEHALSAVLSVREAAVGA